MTTGDERDDAREALRTVERYFDAVPRAGADVRGVGPFTVFLPPGGHGSAPGGYYARPTLGHRAPITADDVREVMAVQVARGQTVSLEWVLQTSPTVADAARAAGLEVVRHPLLVLARRAEIAPLPGLELRELGPGDPALVAVRAAVHAAFDAGGTGRGEDGPAARDAAVERLDPDGIERLTMLMRQDRLVMLGAFDAAAGAVGGGTHRPLDGVSELTGIGVLPAFRRRGVGARITAALVADALARGTGTVCLSAQDDAVARLYEGVGFVRIGDAGEARVPVFGG